MFSVNLKANEASFSSWEYLKYVCDFIRDKKWNAEEYSRLALNEKLSEVREFLAVYDFDEIVTSKLSDINIIPTSSTQIIHSIFLQREGVFEKIDFQPAYGSELFWGIEESQKHCSVFIYTNGLGARGVIFIFKKGQPFDLEGFISWPPLGT